MSLAQALNSSLSGLRATQAGLSLIAANVANAQTAGYVRKTVDLTASAAGDFGSSVRVTGVSRELDEFVQRQLRVETSGGAYADLRASFYQRLQQIYGDPGTDSALETVFNSFTSALQSLVTSPDSVAARSIVLNSAQLLAQSLNGMTVDIQAMRADAESGIANAVQTANTAMQKIAEINAQLGISGGANASDAALMDQRDSYIDQLSELMDIRVVAGDHNQVSIFTNSGIQLVGTKAAQLAFNAYGTVSAVSEWNSDPSQSTLGTLTLVSPSGATTDLIASKSIRSGKIAAYLDMRDNVLVQAQAQLDSLAATMAKALSDQNVDGSAVTVGAQSGFDVDTAGVLDGNTINFTYTEVGPGTQHRVTIVRVDDPGALPLADTATADPNDEVYGVDFSGGLAAVATQLNTLFGGLVQFSNPSGSTLRILDDGAPNLSDIDAASVTTTATSLSGGSAAFGFFTDGASPYTGAISSIGDQSIGFAGRIAVNAGLLIDGSKLVVYGSGVAAGDPTRPNFIYQQLTGTTFQYLPKVGLGSASLPFSGSVPSFLRQTLSMQGEAAANADRLSQGQTVVVNALKQRMQDISGVNVDQEMANLINLQTAYGANARVMSAIKDMIDTLLNI
jgi:flagellar hook-associated protein 1 FlgK